MEQDILSIFNKQSANFSKGQKLIVNYIMENYDKAAFMTAGKLGRAVGVSESTVVRFAADLGYDGYPGMKKALQDMVRTKLTSVQRIEVAEDLILGENILKAVLENDLENLQETIDEADDVSFSKAVDAIVSAKRVYVCAMRTSKHIAEFFGTYLSMMMDNVKIVRDAGAVEAYEELIRIEEGDVFIGFTFPRYSSRAIKAMEYAKNHGAMTIGITDSEGSPFYGTADLCLFAKCEMMSFIDSLVAPMSLINALLVAVGYKSREELSETFKRLEDVWTEYEVYDKLES